MKNNDGPESFKTIHPNQKCQNLTKYQPELINLYKHPHSNTWHILFKLLKTEDKEKSLQTLRGLRKK